MRSSNNLLTFLWALILLLYWQTYFLYSYEENLFRYCYEKNKQTKTKPKKKKKKLAVTFNHTHRCIDNVLSINNHNFHNNVHLIYPDKLEIKNTTESDTSASYLDILLILTQMVDWQLHYMTNVFILTLQSSTFLFYIVIYDFHLLIVCKSTFCVWQKSW
jgi:hypothetical protein